ncbi:MAG: TlpA family protein disulfide reductase [Flavobacteriales bacterium]|jgi:thiol-disulfide isomerase/thioredoxin|nr:TlpA family protein disulfide reductase [Flavobacteriales bacterium]
MKKSVWITSLLFLLFNVACGQKQHFIEGAVEKGYTIKELSLKKYGVTNDVVTEIKVDNNKFKTAIPNNCKKGMYQLYLKEEHGVELVFDVIITGENDVELFIHKRDVNARRIEPNKVFETKDPINLKWKSYSDENLKNSEALSLLRNTWLTYPLEGDEKFLKQIKKQLKVLSKRNDQIIERAKADHEFLGALLSMKPKLYVDISAKREHQDSLLFLNSLKMYDLNQPELWNSPAYQNLFNRYLGMVYNKNKHLQREDLELEMVTGVDEIMDQITDTEVKGKAVNLLTQLFIPSGFDIVVRHIDLVYGEEGSCDNDEIKHKRERRIEGYKRMKKGNIAPAITGEGQENMLNSLDSDYKIVVFWASWCPHCMQMMPELNKWFDWHPNAKAIAVSLDTDPTSYKNTIISFPNFKHTSEFKKWESENVKNYFVTGTPAIFILNKKNEIISQAKNIEELNKVFKTLK